MITPSGTRISMPGKAAAEGVDRGLGGEGAHEDRAVEGGLAVGVRQPGVQRRHGGVQDEPDHDQVDRRRRVVHVQQR